ncbi:sigma-70 family RNA polymerase sigma factor [Sinomicrobium pectinilyticum]|uniref:Sigma-70 family RNA polymerase sigma factor n=1 Tax=Sinomicrobium pectinilyticum TaxID=1084421 RepID=A0A3N0EIK1_SINP1|nr:sigma-70 family RNA polymerase sigma factor [Sinomicrobium pectinilyticum]RNL87736.1 sigma-70 family RNA polymerase sigma factor [Sinomicrobium pectinilyticum]
MEDIVWNNNMSCTGKPREHHTDSDAELWVAFLSGSAIAFETIYSQNFEALYYYGLKLVPDEALVEDCIQELFILLWAKRERLGKAKVIRAYLYTVLRRNIFEEARKRGKLLTLVDGSERQITGETPPEEPMGQEEGEELSKALDMAMKTLSLKQRELLHLKYHGQMNNREIARITKMPYSQVCYHLKTAIEQLYGNLKRFQP